MLPTGMVTFLFTDIEGSTPLWERDAQAMKASLARHNAILHGAIQENGGRVFKLVGDAFQAAFPLPLQAVAAALAAQRAQAGESWGETGPLAVRMGIHCAPGEIQEGDYAVSHDLNRVARITAAGHGGQILLSRAVAELVRRDLGEDLQLKDLGEHLLKGLSRPERIYQVVAPGLPANFPALASQSAPRHNLPPALTPLLGRESELAEITALLEDGDCRLLTLAGPGGIGKTRLAIRAAESLLPVFPQGAWFVALEALDSADFLAQTIAAALGQPLSEAVTPAEQLLESLRRKELLLVLDNFEHLLPGGIGLLVEILQAAPGVNLLVTSREKLNLQAEWLYHVRGLGFPEDRQEEPQEPYPAVTLFLQLAQRTAGTTLPHEDRIHVPRITRLVEGSPLALELAAAWVRALTCREIAAEIERGLGFLQTSQPDVPERHRSIRAVFDHSWRLLPEEEMAVFRRLSVFRGGFERQSAGHVAGASLDTLAALVDKSLVHRHLGQRYRVHALLRQFVAGELERAGEVEDTRERHLSFFTDLAEEAEAYLTGEKQSIWLERLGAELDNFRAALDCSLAQGDLCLRLAGALWRFWFVRGHLHEGRRWLDQALEVNASSSSPVKVKALNGAGVLAYMQHEYHQAMTYHQESLTIAREHADQSGIASSLHYLGVVLIALGEYQAAESCSKESLERFQEIDDRRGIAIAIRDLADIAKERGDLSLAENYFKEALTLRRALGDQHGVGRLSNDLGVVVHLQGDFERATQLFESALSLLGELHDKLGVANSKYNLGKIALDSGESARANTLFRESLAIFNELGDKKGMLLSLQGLSADT